MMTAINFPTELTAAEFADWRASLELLLDTDFADVSVPEILATARQRIEDLQPRAVSEADFGMANLEAEMLQNLVAVITGPAATVLH